MYTYKNKEELIQIIEKTASLLDQEFDQVDESKKDFRIEDVDKTPSEILSYQLGWLNLLMGWEMDELAGKEVITPTPQYKWNNLGGLYQSFYLTYKDYSLFELREAFRNSVKKVCTWISGLDEETLYTPGIRKWTITGANWPMIRWIHINTAAPFKNFRTKIRKWKKLIS
jgi:hypothetical protein